jgi:hypothetical protein
MRLRERFQVWLSEQDVLRLARLQELLGTASRAEAVRQAVRRQLEAEVARRREHGERPALEVAP